MTASIGCCQERSCSRRFDMFLVTDRYSRRNDLFVCHTCRYDKFHFDITDALNLSRDGVHELAVRVFDPTEFAHVPIGKQRRHPPRHPSGIWYTSSTGIWQTVWLEPVSRIKCFHPHGHYLSQHQHPTLVHDPLHVCPMPCGFKYSEYNTYHYMI